jgi:tRNA G10  N-methylase Trm11
MEYLVRLAQCHETFRQPELQAVATLLGIEMEIMAYNEFVCGSQLNSLPVKRVLRLECHLFGIYPPCSPPFLSPSRASYLDPH